MNRSTIHHARTTRNIILGTIVCKDQTAVLRRESVNGRLALPCGIHVFHLQDIKNSPWWTRKEASTAAQAKGSTPKHEFEEHEQEIRAFIFLDDNIHIVNSSVDGTMRKWNCDTGLVVGKP